MNKLKKIKIVFLSLSKWTGLFRVSKYFTRNGLRILCYHSFSFDDDIYWRPKLFFRPDVFKKRMAFLKKEGIPVLSLDDAVRLLYQNKLPPMATVITIDDGWFSNKFYANDILDEKSNLYTIYVTSYYSMKETPIFSLVIQYMFWKTKKEYIHLDQLPLPFSGKIHISETQKTNNILNKIINYAQDKLDNSGRKELVKNIGELLDVRYDSIEKERKLSLLTASEIKELADAGVDIQLHTHRHCWPMDKQKAYKEIIENRTVLEPLTGKEAVHFCYPSGIWNSQQFSYLAELGIESAATCEPGINYPHTNRYMLKRFLDGADIHQIEFEAELFGFMDFLRKIRFFLQKFY